jgi:hypothetical protein
LKKQSKFCQKSTESLFEAEHVLLFFSKIKFQSQIGFVQKSIDLLIFFNRGAFGFASSAEKNHQPRATSEAKNWTKNGEHAHKKRQQKPHLEIPRKTLGFISLSYITPLITT